MDKVILNQIDAVLADFWGRDALDIFAKEVLILSSWREVLRNTIAVFGAGVVVTVVTLDGDCDYCIWEGAYLEEAWGTNTWFGNRD